MLKRRKEKAKPRTIVCPKCKGTDAACTGCGGTGKVTITPCDHIDALYNEFKVKDMTRAEFRREYKRVMDPRRLNRDLRAIVTKRQIEGQLHGRPL